eukprot:CAMPEP_0116549496 /NCGR_PEP_ID=MMETSP0397-20121206/4907_1 /TAXON_ID=216820 /ORGANISM="Cyclophora tenuis, Strain ECT3854" /LENGTH=363 /DNA_ID=CAMNT_0004074229 /DNA_START=37 /DNA_END=1128 /DNA_ORIENTATION=-
MKASAALSGFARCTGYEFGAMITEFDQQNFGTLDVFEKCAHSYKQEPLHGGYHALGCMKLLKDAIDSPFGGKTNKSDKKNGDVLSGAISSLARLLYYEGEQFCECAKTASTDCPLCPSFQSFKTLLYESLDACAALDEIDCDAWMEFYEPCQENLKRNFGTMDFTNQNQCRYVTNGCGGAGTFPSFRKLDCGQEIDGSAWNFYNIFSLHCSGPGQEMPIIASPIFSYESPIQSPAAASPLTPRPTKVYVSRDDDYYSSAQDQQTYTEKNSSSSFAMWMIVISFTVLGGAGYYIYKKRQESFTFVRYRRAPRHQHFHGVDNGMMYSGLDITLTTNTGSSNTSTFEPPTLPSVSASEQQQYQQQP